MHATDLRYRVVLEADPDDGGFNVRIPAFPAAFTCGDTVEECLTFAREVIELEIAYHREHGIEIPHPDAESAIVFATVTVPAA